MASQVSAMTSKTVAETRTIEVCTQPCVLTDALLEFDQEGSDLASLDDADLAFGGYATDLAPSRTLLRDERGQSSVTKAHFPHEVERHGQASGPRMSCVRS
jgi:hypothetical protein